MQTPRKIAYNLLYRQKNKDILNLKARLRNKDPKIREKGRICQLKYGLKSQGKPYKYQPRKKFPRLKDAKAGGKEEWLKQNVENVKLGKEQGKTILNCVICNVEFVKLSNKHKYCSREYCFRPWWHREWYKKSKIDEVTGEVKKKYPLVKCQFCEVRFEIDFDIFKHEDRYSNLVCPACNKKKEFTYDDINLKY